MTEGMPWVKFGRMERPERCPGGYVFHAYCDHENPEHEFDEFPHEPGNVQSRAQAIKSLKSYGWRFHKDGTATCPKCVAATKRDTK